MNELPWPWCVGVLGRDDVPMPRALAPVVESEIRETLQDTAHKPFAGVSVANNVSSLLLLPKI